MCHEILVTTLQYQSQVTKHELMARLILSTSETQHSLHQSRHSECVLEIGPLITIAKLFIDSYIKLVTRSHVNNRSCLGLFRKVEV
jgi:hypothetical protein